MGLWESYLKSLKTTEQKYQGKFPYDMLKPPFNMHIHDQGTTGSSVGFSCVNALEASRSKFEQLSDLERELLLQSQKPLYAKASTLKPLKDTVVARKQKKLERKNKKKGRR